MKSKFGLIILIIVTFVHAETVGSQVFAGVKDLLNPDPKILYDSITNRGVVSTNLKLFGIKEQKEINDITESVFFSIKLYDYFKVAPNILREAIHIRKFNNYVNVSDKVLDANKILQKVTGIIKNINLEIESIDKVRKISYLKSGQYTNAYNKITKKMSSLIVIKTEAENILRGTNSYSRVLAKEMDDSLNILTKYSNIIAKESKVVTSVARRANQLMTELGYLAIATDAGFMTKALYDGDGGAFASNFVNGAIHTAQLVPLVGMITTPVELLVNYATDSYDNHTDNIFTDFTNKLNVFDYLYNKATLDIDNLFKNNYTADEFRNKFYNTVLSEYIKNIIANVDFTAVVPFKDLMEVTIPYTDFVASTISTTENILFNTNDMKSARISSYQMVADYYLMRMPIFFKDGKIPELNSIVFFTQNTSQGYGWKDEWTDEFFKKSFINPLIELSKNDISIIERLKEFRKENKNCKISFEGLKKKIEKNVYDIIINDCKNPTYYYKVTANEYWLINRFEKKLKHKKYTDLTKYVQMTLLQNRITKRGNSISTNFILDRDGYITLNSYSKSMPNTLEEKDINSLKSKLNLTNELKSYNQKWDFLRDELGRKTKYSKKQDNLGIYLAGFNYDDKNRVDKCTTRGSFFKALGFHMKPRWWSQEAQDYVDNNADKVISIEKALYFLDKASQEYFDKNNNSIAYSKFLINPLGDYKKKKFYKNRYNKFYKNMNLSPEIKRQYILMQGLAIGSNSSQMRSLNQCLTGYKAINFLYNYKETLDFYKKKGKLK